MVREEGFACKMCKRQQLGDPRSLKVSYAHSEVQNTDLGKKGQRVQVQVIT